MKEKAEGILVAIDSMTLVWGIRSVGTPEQLQRARYLFEQLEIERAQIMVPAIALSEYLTAIEPRDHKNSIAALNKRFLFPPFDIRCASMAARLFAAGKQLRKGDIPGGRACLRADCLIIATAAIHGAMRLYSGDAECRELAKTHTKLDVMDLPQIAPHLYVGVGTLPTKKTKRKRAAKKS